MKNIFVIVLSIISSIIIVNAEEKDKIVGTVDYVYGDSESFLDAQKMAKSEALKNAIESYSVYINSTVSLENGELKESLIRSISASYLESVNYRCSENRNERKLHCTAEALVSKKAVNELVKSISVDGTLYKDPPIQKLQPSETKTKLTNTKKEKNNTVKNKPLKDSSKEHKKSDLIKHVKEIIEKAVEKKMSSVVTEVDLEWLVKNKEYEIKIDFDDIVLSELKNDSELKKQLNKLYKNEFSKTGICPTILEKYIYKKSVWGFELGQYKFEDENVLIESGIRAFFKYVGMKLLPKLKSTKKKVDIVAIGYTDHKPIRSGIFYDLRKRAFCIDNDYGCPNSLNKLSNRPPAQPIFFNDHRWVKIGNKLGLQKRQIGEYIFTNCELSFARGYEAIKYIKKLSNVLNKEEQLFFKYAYSGKGVDHRSLNGEKKRKIILILRQSIYSSYER